MDTKRISALLLAAETGSLTAAANQLGYTQSGMTHMMNSLEDELGVSLLIRSKTGVQLSPGGQSLLPEMRALIAAADSLSSAASSLRANSAATFSLGAFASVARSWLPAIISEFKGSYPDLDVSLTVGDMEGLYNAVRNEHIDCAIVSYQESLAHGVSWYPLRNDELVAIIPQEPAFPGSSYPTVLFDGSHFLMPSSGFEMDIAPVFKNIAPNVRYTNMDDGAIVSMVEHGLGVSILSELIMRDMVNYVQVLPLAPSAYRRLGIIVSSRRSSDKQIKRFIQSAASTLSAMYRDGEERWA